MSVGRSVWLDLLSDAERAALEPGVPEPLDRHPNVLIVGGGIVGMATAAACIQKQLGSVLVIERDRLGSGPSGGGAGLLVPTAHHGLDPVPLVDLGYASLAAWRELHASWPGGVGLVDMDWMSLEPRPFGTAPDPPHAERLSADEVARLAPDVGAPVPAVLVPREARMNPLRAIARIAAELPGRVASGVTATSVQLRGDRITAVQTNYGEIQADVTIFATGLAPTIEGLALDLPQSQIKGHIIATEPTDVRLPGTVDPFGSQIEDGRLLCGGTFDEGDDSLEIHPEPVAELWSDLSGGIPRVAGTRISHRWACFRPAHPDRLPVIDRVPDLANAWLTSGHFRTGILMAAATGTCLAEWIRTGGRPELVAAFGVDRLLALKTQR